jgi:hypothetical protein
MLAFLKRRRWRRGKKMQSTSIQKMYEMTQRSRAALQNMRRREKESTSELVTRAGVAASVILGGALAGAIDGKWGHDGKPVGEHDGIAAIGPVPINIGTGLVAMALGVSGFLPGAEYLTGLGSSLIGYSVGKTVEAKMLAGK